MNLINKACKQLLLGFIFNDLPQFIKIEVNRFNTNMLNKIVKIIRDNNIASQKEPVEKLEALLDSHENVNSYDLFQKFAFLLNHSSQETNETLINIICQGNEIEKNILIDVCKKIQPSKNELEIILNKSEQEYQKIIKEISHIKKISQYVQQRHIVSATNYIGQLQKDEQPPHIALFFIMQLPDLNNNTSLLEYEKEVISNFNNGFTHFLKEFPIKILTIAANKKYPVAQMLLAEKYYKTKKFTKALKSIEDVLKNPYSSEKLKDSALDVYIPIKQKVDEFIINNRLKKR